MILMFSSALGKGERLQWMQRGYRGSGRQTEKEMRLFMCVYNQFGQSKLRVFLFFPPGHQQLIHQSSIVLEALILLRRHLYNCVSPPALLLGLLPSSPLWPMRQ